MEAVRATPDERADRMTRRCRSAERPSSVAAPSDPGHSPWASRSTHENPQSRRLECLSDLAGGSVSSPVCVSPPRRAFRVAEITTADGSRVFFRARLWQPLPVVVALLASVGLLRVAAPLAVVPALLALAYAAWRRPGWLLGISLSGTFVYILVLRLGGH